MLKRLFLGLLIGAAVGALVAAGAIAVLGTAVMPMGPFVAFTLAAVTGVLTGLVAGKPIWAKGGQIEAGLKAFFGALLAAAGMYAVRTWLHFDVDLTVARAGHDLVGNLPAASLPLIGAVLGGLYELDNTPEAKDEGKAGAGAGRGGRGGARVAGNVRVAEDASRDEDEAAPPTAAKKRSR
jgi:hypothetical protein